MDKQDSSIWVKLLRTRRKKRSKAKIEAKQGYV